MTGIHVLVADDEPLARRRLIRLLTKLDWVGQIDEASNAVEARLKIEQKHPDILLLDVQMPSGSGFDVLTQLVSPPPVTIFVTAFDQYALRAFEASAIDYLTKPIDSGRFFAAMQKAKSAVGSRFQTDRIAELQEMIASLKEALKPHTRQKYEFWVKSMGEYVRIVQDDIIRFQAERDYVRIHVSGASYLYQETLSSLEQRLDPDEFIRIHRSCIIRKTAIAKVRKAPFSTQLVILHDGSELRVGRSYSKKLWSNLN